MTDDDPFGGYDTARAVAVDPVTGNVYVVPAAGTVCQQNFSPFDVSAVAAGTNPLR